jgi:serine/threonine protein phosphatase 1
MSMQTNAASGGIALRRSSHAPPRGRHSSAGGQLIYAVGDIHGCYDLMRSLLAMIAADWSSVPPGHRPALIFCGDYVDRGPDSAKVLQALVWLQRRTDVEVHILKGNHEQGLLNFLDQPATGDAWLRFGGAQTLISYGIDPPSAEAGVMEILRARDALLETMPAAHLRLLQSLELMALAGDYAFVHAGVRPGVALTQQAEQDLLWIRRDFIDAPSKSDKVIVHGHTWTDDQPIISEQRIGLDTGAYETGVLTALRLEDGRLDVFQAAQDLKCEGPASDVTAKRWAANG